MNLSNLEEKYLNFNSNMEKMKSLNEMMLSIESTKEFVNLRENLYPLNLPKNIERDNAVH